MIDDWFDHVELAILIAEFHRLPQNPAYKDEYFDGRALLSPRPRGYHATFDLASFVPPAEVVTDDPWDGPVAVRPLFDDQGPACRICSRPASIASSRSPACRTNVRWKPRGPVSTTPARERTAH